jgi:hypothetical protein
MPRATGERYRKQLDARRIQANEIEPSRNPLDRAFCGNRC